MMVALGIISAVGTPRLYGRTEYTIIGSGRCSWGGQYYDHLRSGTSDKLGCAVVTALPDGSGESFAALAAVGLPLTYVFYKLSRTDTTPIGAQQNGSTLIRTSSGKRPSTGPTARPPHLHDSNRTPPPDDRYTIQHQSAEYHRCRSIRERTVSDGQHVCEYLEVL